MVSIYSLGWWFTLGLLLIASLILFMLKRRCAQASRHAPAAANIACSKVALPKPAQAFISQRGLPVAEFTSSVAFKVADLAGDNLIATQLDLARAYIDMDDIQLAQDILQSVLQQGTPQQQVEAKMLLAEVNS